MKLVFFYGLFMDEELLQKQGFSPSSPILAYLDNYGLRIGERATLVYSRDERAYGTIMELEEDDLNRLYSSPSVSDYVPELVTVQDLNGNERQAISYNLPSNKLAGKNKEYAASLAVVAGKVGLPQSYIEEINSWKN